MLSYIKTIQTKKTKSVVGSYLACELEAKLLSPGRQRKGCRKAGLIPEVRAIHISMMWFHAADTLNGFDAFKRTLNATPAAIRKKESTGKPSLKKKSQYDFYKRTKKAI